MEYRTPSGFCCCDRQPDETWPETVLVVECQGQVHFLPLSAFVQRACALSSVWEHVIGIVDLDFVRVHFAEQAAALAGIETAAALVEREEWAEEAE